MLITSRNLLPRQNKMFMRKPSKWVSVMFEDRLKQHWLMALEIDHTILFIINLNTLFVS